MLIRQTISNGVKILIRCNVLDYTYRSIFINYTFGPGVSQLWRVVPCFLTSFVIPEGIEELYHTFEGCERLTIDGITFPSTLKVIEEDTFGGCLAFTGTFEIPETVEKLGYNVFTGCDNLEKVVIPTSVIELTGNPFGVDHSDNYPGTVEYKGTMEQWNQITGASNQLPAGQSPGVCDCPPVRTA